MAQETNPTFRSEVADLIEADALDELSDRFYRGLEFGTGGMRGVIGGGFNRMNPYNIRRITQGLADYVLAHGSADAGALSAVIAHDSRRYSELFALEAGLVLAANGITVHLFPSLRPTPELSFVVRTLRANTGIVITASHNPPQYNGYKVYWSDGAQVVPPHDRGIADAVAAVIEAKSMEKEEAERRGLIKTIGPEMDRAFYDMVKRQSLRPELVRRLGRDLRVVYTPLHGTGGLPVSTVLGEMGVRVTIVPEQKEPDGEFPTVEYPNPEEASAMAMALELGEKMSADLVMGTDPDADRLGIAVPGQTGLELITGNQLGALLMDYILSSRQEQGMLPDNAVVIKTIVTTELHRRIAEAHGVRCIDTLTGFKYMGEKIREFESTPGGPTYLFGSEESYGYLIGTEVRDKDAVTAAVVTAEMTLYHKSEGRSLLDALDRLYRKHGYFQEILVTKSFPGQEGFREMQALMERFRTTPPEGWGGSRTKLVLDYLNGTSTRPGGRPGGGDVRKDIDLPPSNVLQFVQEDTSVVTVRPSGTEPKIKFYASCNGMVRGDLRTTKEQVAAQISLIEKEIEQRL
jgi:phosphoglucomutase